MRTEVLSFRKNTPPKISSALIAVIITALLNAGFILMLGTSFELEFPVFPAVLFAVIASSVFTAVHYPGIKKLSAGAFIAAPALTLLFVLFNWFHTSEMCSCLSGMHLEPTPVFSLTSSSHASSPHHIALTKPSPFSSRALMISSIVLHA